MKLAIIGAAGRVGRGVVAEALARGHDVTAVVRRRSQLTDLSKRARGAVADAAKAESMATVAEGQDVMILATRSPRASVEETVSVTEAALGGAGRAGARLLVVGGAAVLRTPNGGRVLDDERYLPEAYRSAGLASAAQLEACRGEPRTDWAYLCPPAELAPGERTGRFRRGVDRLIVDPEGRSRISMEDLAVAVLDEAERPSHHRSCFTVGY
ncbi:MAG: NAD(P)-dependent oxidoreductase [Sandaracinaceae bacterium]